MPKATNDPSTANLVEADAFIVRDAQGRKRILLGNLWPAESGEWYPGVALYDEHGSERVCLLLGDAGPVLSFAERGNTRLELGLDQRGRNPGSPYVAVLDASGCPMTEPVGPRVVAGCRGRWWRNVRRTHDRMTYCWRQKEG